MEDGGGGAPTGQIPHHLDNLERLGRIVNVVGVPLLMVFFLALNIGWIDGPIGKSIRENNAMNEKIYAQNEIHHRKVLEMEVTRQRELQEAAVIIKRLTELVKMIDCAQIPDLRLRERCLAR